ncbi:hypothetical protein P43SY_010149 [Pythium insidiosum]|uniref:Protein kinase domain-containing protein n=1 Tax=Pythium insidiosum TaxID=114742 RepID=A0AAD5LI22_PYTIN|nr:hypothetical protein P43SY_010149 [Pythium insidiosum]
MAESLRVAVDVTPPTRLDAGVQHLNCSSVVTLTTYCFNASDVRPSYSDPDWRPCVGSASDGTCPRGPWGWGKPTTGSPRHINASALGIERVVLLPRPSLEVLNLRYNRLATLQNLQRDAVMGFRELDLSWNLFSSFEAIQVFEFLERLVARNASLSELYTAHAGRLLTVIAPNNRLSSFASVSFPNKLRTLDLSFNAFIDWSSFTPPRALRILNASHNGATQFPSGMWSVNDKLEVVDFSNNALTSVVNITWPKSLTNIDLRRNPIETIEIRESDVPTFERLAGFHVDPDVVIKCRSKGAIAKRLGSGVTVCVVADSRFEPPSSDSRAWVVAAVLSSIVAVLALAALLWFMKRRQRQRARLTGGPTRSGSSSSSAVPIRDSLRPLFDEIHADPTLAAFLLTADDWAMVRLVTKGPFCKVSLVRVGDKDVAMKKLRRNVALRDDAAVARFVRELQANATLEHRKLVRFIGFSWSTQLDLAVFCEFMPAGSLDAALRQRRATSSALVDALRWQPSPDASTVSKLDIALDVAEALLYLHSYEPPVVHGHIRARNVLLTESWTAKLGSVGMPFDREHAQEQGLVPWLAPEVLRGDAVELDAATDVYAFGVFLAELDSGDTPFTAKGALAASLAQEIVSGLKTTTSLFRGDCPAEILAIARACSDADAEKRPTAMKLYYDLSQLRRTWREGLGAE